MILAGMFVPIPFYLAHRLWPKAGFNYVFTPVVVAELGFLEIERRYISFLRTLKRELIRNETRALIR